MRGRGYTPLMDTRTTARAVLAAALGAEAIAAHQRFAARRELFARATARARETGRPLVVVGDPHGGAHTRLIPAYGCGDLTLDLTGCPSCPNGLAVNLDRERVSSVPDDSAVVYVSCVLEYVGRPDAAWQELLRMAGSTDNLFVVGVQPWSMTAALYPGAQRTVRVAGRELVSSPVSTERKVATVAGLALLAYLSFRPERKAPREALTAGRK